jgi:hypothetical protein
MALEKSVQSNFGFNVEKAYIRVENLTLESKDKARCIVKFYADKEMHPFDVQSFLFDYLINGSNPIAQAYEHLKTLPEFSGATDC